MRHSCVQKAFKGLLVEVQIAQPSIWGHLWYGPIYLILVPLPSVHTAHTSKPDDWPFRKHTLLFPSSCLQCYLKDLLSPNSTHPNVPCPSRTLFKTPMKPFLRVLCNLLLTPNILNLGWWLSGYSSKVFPHNHFWTVSFDTVHPVQVHVIYYSQLYLTHIRDDMITY